MAGLLYLKHTFALSDEELIARWVENAYWQYFCGETYFQHEPPIHPTSLTRYRQRLGPAGCEELLQLTIEAGVAEKVIEERDMAEVLIDTTVMEKAITYPTDSKLYLKSLLRLNRQAKAHGIGLRQSYTRTGKRLAIKASRYAHARQYRRMRKALKQLKGRLGRVVRDIERKTADWPSLPDTLAHELKLSKRLLAQQPKSRNKLYSLHAPEAECISKVKAHKRYEFGVKVSVATTLRSNFVLASHALPGNPYDGHTLPKTLLRCFETTGKVVKAAFVDRGRTVLDDVDHRGHVGARHGVIVAAAVLGALVVLARDGHHVGHVFGDLHRALVVRRRARRQRPQVALATQRHRVGGRHVRQRNVARVRHLDREAHRVADHHLLDRKSVV